MTMHFVRATQTLALLNRLGSGLFWAQVSTLTENTQTGVNVIAHLLKNCIAGLSIICCTLLITLSLSSF